MKLTYRGIAYEPSFPTVETTQTERIGLYRGSTVAIRQVTAKQRRSAPAHLKYRGAEYTR